MGRVTELGSCPVCGGSRKRLGCSHKICVGKLPSASVYSDTEEKNISVLLGVVKSRQAVKAS